MNTAKKPDYFDIYWELHNYCNFHCPGCPLPQSHRRGVYLRERLFHMASLPLSLPYKAYHITFSGGEPFYHPLLRDLVSYFLSCGRKIQITIETNGSLPLNHYTSMLKMASKASLRLHIQAHPCISDVKKLITLIGVTRDLGQLAHVTLWRDSAASPEYSHMFAVLVHARQSFPFSLSLETASGENADTFAHIQAFSAAAQTGPRLSAPALPGSEKIFACVSQDTVRFDDSPEDQFGHDCFCYAGCDFLRIDADGSYYGAMCGMAKGEGSLWEASAADLAALPKIVKCPHALCKEKRDARLPKFKTLVEADHFQATYLETLDAMAWEAGTWPGIDDREQDTRRILQAELENLRRIAGKSTDIGKHAQLVSHWDFTRKNIGVISAVATALAEDAGRDTFLRAVICAETGSADILAEADVKKDLQPQSKAWRQLTIAEGKSRAIFKELLATAGEIDLHRPKLQLVFDAHSGEFLMSAGWLLANFPDYRLRMEVLPKQCGRVLLTGQSKLAPRSWSDSCNRPLASVIVLAQGRDDAIERSVDSVLVNCAYVADIIIIANEKDDEAIAASERLATMRPDLITAVTVQKETARSDAFQLAMELASGKYATFLAAGDMIDPGFLENGINTLERENADIACPAYVVDVCRLQPQAIIFESGQRNVILRSFLEGEAGPARLPGRIYAAAVLHGRWLASANTCLPEEIVTLRAFAQAKKVVVITQTYFAASSPLNTDGHVLENFAFFLRELNIFAKFHNVPDSWLRAFRKEKYLKERDDILAELRANSGRAKSGYFLPKGLLKDLTSSRDVVCLLLADLAYLAEPDGRGESLPILAAESNVCTCFCQIEYQPYADADKEWSSLPTLSVIMPNYNGLKHLSRAVESILSQSMRDFELIIIDDASVDGSLALLQAWAHRDRRIRLYHMDANMRQGICRNVGIEKARGKYLLFVDSDDICLPGYFELALEEMENGEFDAVLFGATYMDENGILLWQNFTDGDSARIIGRKRALEEFFNGILEPAPWAKIMRADLVKNASCRFDEYVYHQDVPFLFSVLNHAKTIKIVPVAVYQYQKTTNSSLHPQEISYLHFYSVWLHYMRLQEAINTVCDKNAAGPCVFDLSLLARWNIKNILLGYCRVSLAYKNEIPLNKADLRMLQQSPVFMDALLRCLAETDTQKQFVRADVHTGNQVNILQPAIVTAIIIANGDYNALARTLDSILAQSLCALEVLVFTLKNELDKCKLCLPLNTQGRRIEFVPMPPCQLSEMLNLATGEYVMFIEAGYELLQDSLLRAVASMRQHSDFEMIQFAGQGERLDLAYGSRHSGLQALSFWLAVKNMEYWPPLFAVSFLRENLKASYSSSVSDMLPVLFAQVKTAGLVRLNATRKNRNLTRKAPAAMTAGHALLDMNKLATDAAAMSDNAGRDYLLRALKNEAITFLELAAQESSSLAQGIKEFLESSFFASLVIEPFFLGTILEACAETLAKAENWQPTSLDSEELTFSILPQIYHRARAGGKRPVLSVILYSTATNDGLAVALDIIKEWRNGGVEIIIAVDSAWHNSQLQLVRDFCVTADNITVLSASKTVGRAVMLNSAMRTTRGAYVWVLEAAQISPSLHWRQTFEFLRGQNTDALLLSPKVQRGTLGRMAALRQLAAGVSFSLGHMLFKTEFLRKTGAFFTPGDVEGRLFVAQALGLGANLTSLATNMSVAVAKNAEIVTGLEAVNMPAFVKNSIAKLTAIYANSDEEMELALEFLLAGAAMPALSRQIWHDVVKNLPLVEFCANQKGCHVLLRRAMLLALRQIDRA